MQESIKQIFKDAFNIKEGTASVSQIEKDILESSQVKGTNFTVLILAIIIASVGLNINSIPIVIGAMLISPLMGNIIAIGYGYARLDLDLTKDAFIGFAIQAILSVITATIYFALSPINIASSELLARITPTFFDVIIAICGGVAGIIGITRKKKNNVIPGVAIATALMPPLCTAGYGIGTGQLNYFLGASYLFFINAFFIAVSALIVVRLLGVRKKKYEGDEPLHLRRNLIILTIILVLPAIYIGVGIVNDTIEKGDIDNYLKIEFKFENTQVVTSNIDLEAKQIKVALIGEILDEKQISVLQNKLQNYSLSEYTLKVTQTPIQGGVTTEELQAMLDKTTQDADAAHELTIKNQQIIDLTKQVEEKEQIIAKYNLDIVALQQEIIALNPEINNVYLGMVKTTREIDEVLQSEEIYIFSYSGDILVEQEEQLVNWLKVKLKTDKIKVIKE